MSKLYEDLSDLVSRDVKHDFDIEKLAQAGDKIAKSGLFDFYDPMIGNFMFTKSEYDRNIDKIKQFAEENDYYGVVTEPDPDNEEETLYFLTNMWDGGYEDNDYSHIIIMPKKKYEEDINESYEENNLSKGENIALLLQDLFEKNGITGGPFGGKPIKADGNVIVFESQGPATIITCNDDGTFDINKPDIEDFREFGYNDPDDFEEEILNDESLFHFRNIEDLLSSDYTLFMAIDGIEPTIELYNDIMSKKEESLTEAPDEYGLPTDDELADEEAKARAEFEKQLADKRAKRDQDRVEAENKAKEEKEFHDRMDAIFDEVKSSNDITDWFDRLVPSSGKAETKAGEMVRAMNRIIYRWFNDGDLFYEEYGLETCGSSAQYLINEGPESVSQQLVSIAEQCYDDDEYGDALNYTANLLIDYLQDNPEDLYIKNQTDSTSDFELDDNLIRKYDIDVDIPEELDEHVRKGHISERDIEWRVEDLIQNSSNAEINVYSYYVEVSNISREDYDELNRHLYRELIAYAEELDEEYPDIELGVYLEDNRIKLLRSLIHWLETEMVYEGDDGEEICEHFADELDGSAVFNDYIDENYDLDETFDDEDEAEEKLDTIAFDFVRDLKNHPDNLSGITEEELEVCNKLFGINKPNKEKEEDK